MHRWEIIFKIFRSKNGKVFSVNICDDVTDQAYDDSWVNKWYIYIYCESLEVEGLLPLKIGLIFLHKLYKMYL